MRERVLCAWSGGKDSAMALYELQRAGRYEVAALLTTVTEDYGRVSMHGVRSALLERQARALGLPLEKVGISKGSTDAEYEEKMGEALARYRAQGVFSVAFGDIFLEELRRYREGNLSKAGMRGLFPLWKRDTLGLAREFVALGFKAVVTCADSEVLEGRFAGRDYDGEFLSELPDSVDPCGENGEFHSFVYRGPIFRAKVGFQRGDVVLRDNRFYFCDLMPA